MCFDYFLAHFKLNNLSTFTKFSYFSTSIFFIQFLNFLAAVSVECCVDCTCFVCERKIKVKKRELGNGTGNMKAHCKCDDLLPSNKFMCI